MLWPDAFVRVLSRIDFLDHHPMLIRMNGNVTLRDKSCFRFENAWLAEKDYKKMLEASWDKYDHIGTNLVKFQDEVGKWKFKTLNQVKFQKRKILHGIKGVQTQLQRKGRTNRLAELELELQQRLDDLLRQEEMMCF